MSYAISTDGIPTLRDYAAAVAHEAKIKPIRGKTLKPLGKRKNHNMQIRRDGDNIVCQLYNTDCVTYYPDGRIHLNHGRFRTVTTSSFIATVSPFVAHNKDSLMMVSVAGGTYQIPDEGLFIKDGEVLNPVPFKVHKLIKPVIKELRGRYKELLQRAVALCNLADGVVPGDHHPWNRYALPKLELPEVYDPADTELVVKLLFLSSSNNYSWQYKQHITRTSVPRIKRMLDHLLFTQHRDEVFEVAEVPLGEYVRDTYKKYFR